MTSTPQQHLRVGIYSRVSTSDKDQDPETQLLPLREFVSAQGWQVYQEYVDFAPATDLGHRYQWRQLLEDASKRKLDLLLVWRMDRAFRSVLDTTSPFGEALYYITVAYAQLERGILRERVKAGMDRARKQGKRIGRPKVTDRRGFKRRFGAIWSALSGEKFPGARQPGS